ncbi:glutathione synthase [Lentinula aciculospora]|uniref:Glutathione synthetase n=1 Tax=Lentinula aciculospora TaxID=153920 RepID=A0A9W9AI42_9AGAR|nr:glutathione synthase [Lentinula aciculospora]
MSAFDFTQWPPLISDKDREILQFRATSYALAHGLLYLPPGAQPSAPTSAIHAPISLFPTPFPRDLFKQAQKLQSIYNILYSRIAMDTEFLDQTMGTEVGVGQVDEFTGKLWSGWLDLREKGLVQPLHLGLFRSDYLLHQRDSDLSLKQVEFNTISSSFGALSQKTAEMHRSLETSTNVYHASANLTASKFPSNHSTSDLVKGLAAAHLAYNVDGSRILFVVQAGERNVFDQLWLEYELLEKHSIHVVRRTFDELAHQANISHTDSVLRIELPDQSAVEISTVYYRSGYTPDDFPTNTQYETRFNLERSKAIKCPTIPLQLAGGKKVQQVLTEPGVLERFLCDEAKYGPQRVFSVQTLAEIRESWMEMWALDLNGEFGVRQARKRASDLVLKPQREGGGNNVYKEAIPGFLDSLSVRERPAWIAMELISPPVGLKNYLVRAGSGASVETEVVSELGIFGWSLFGGGKVISEREAGWLVRTKGKDSNEGGVATGFSVLDSLVLVD